MVDRARKPVSQRYSYHHPSQHLRPINKATEVSVPCSASNLSNNGVSAKIFNNAWKNPIWINGKVLSRYTSYRLAPCILIPSQHKA